jgi:hypothetical protein
MKQFPNCTYSTQSDFSYVGEQFVTVPCHWRPGSFNTLKIRKASWKPKQNRNNSAIYYFDVKTTEEVNTILESFKNFDFKQIEKEYVEQYGQLHRILNTGENTEWWIKTFIPYIRKKYPVELTEANIKQ